MLSYPTSPTWPLTRDNHLHFPNEKTEVGKVTCLKQPGLRVLGPISTSSALTWQPRGLLRSLQILLEQEGEKMSPAFAPPSPSPVLELSMVLMAPVLHLWPAVPRHPSQSGFLALVHQQKKKKISSVTGTSSKCSLTADCPARAAGCWGRSKCRVRRPEPFAASTCHVALGKSQPLPEPSQQSVS